MNDKTKRNGRKNSTATRKTAKRDYSKSNNTGKAADSAYSYTTSNHVNSNVKPMDKSGLNDFSWYNRYPELIASTAKLAFPFRPGMEITKGISIKRGNAETNYNIMNPGALVVNWIPSVGRSNTVTDPASLAAKEMYTKVRSAFSGTISADAPDFLIQMVAMDSIFAYLAYLKRIYRIVNTTSPNNYLMPYGFMEALRFSVEQTNAIMENRSTFLFNINTLIRLTDQLRVPAKFDFITRHYWMSDNIYMDADTFNSQAIIFRPVGFYEFALQPDTQGVQVGSLNFKGLNVRDVAAADIVAFLYNYGLQLINSLTAWDDCYTINGYLERAFEGAPLFGVDVLLESEQIALRYSPEVLSQIENSSALNIPASLIPNAKFNGTITQDPKTNAVIANPSFTVDGAANTDLLSWNEGGLVSLRSENPSPEEIIIATRMRTIGVPSVTGENLVFSIYSGSEIVHSYSILTYDVQTSSYYTISFGSNIYFGLGADKDAVSTRIVRYLSNVDWAPIMPITYANNDTANNIGLFGDIHNIGYLDAPTYQALNRICLLSQFAAFSD